MNTENLIKISTYAKEIGKSVQWVYKLIEAGDVKIREIDGVKFVIKK